MMRIGGCSNCFEMIYCFAIEMRGEKMIIWHVNDFGGSMLSTISQNARDLPAPLPWIEPSINNLHLESVYSFLVGNYECSIMSISSLLEHVLRLAIINKNECGMHRRESAKKKDSFSSLNKLIDQASTKDIFNGCNESWWRAAAKTIRNKSAHYILPTMLRTCAEEDELKKYIIELEMPENYDTFYYERYITDWGSFYHKAGRYIAKGFISDATEEIRKVINNTAWVGDVSWWLSLKTEYELFFSYNWSVENIEASFKNAYTSVNTQSYT